MISADDILEIFFAGLPCNGGNDFAKQASALKRSLEFAGYKIVEANAPETLADRYRRAGIREYCEKPNVPDIVQAIDEVPEETLKSPGPEPGLPRHFKVGDKVRRRRDTLGADGSEAIVVDVEMIGGREMVTARFLNHRETFLWDAYELIVGLPTIEG